HPAVYPMADRHRYSGDRQFRHADRTLVPSRARDVSTTRRLLGGDVWAGMEHHSTSVYPDRADRFCKLATDAHAIERGAGNPASRLRAVGAAYRASRAGFVSWLWAGVTVYRDKRSAGIRRSPKNARDHRRWNSRYHARFAGGLAAGNPAGC